MGTCASAATCAALFLYFGIIKNEYLGIKNRSANIELSVSTENFAANIKSTVSTANHRANIESNVSTENHAKLSKEIANTKSFCTKKALKLAIPIAIEKVAFTGALVVVTKIIAPLGPVVIAANSFATTAEALCYMPGYGFGEASTTLVGQSMGAKRTDLAKSFAWISVLFGVLSMSLMGIIMYFACPLIFKFLSSDQAIRELSTKVLRIELFAEPFYAAAIVAMEALRGAQDTVVPCILNLMSIWLVRITLSLILVGPLGLEGIWIAMAIELCVRGILMLIRLFTSKSLRN